MSWSIRDSAGRRWEIVRANACSDPHCKTTSGARDEFSARQRLQQFKADSMLMAGLRQALASEFVGSGVHQASDNDVIERASRLILSGVWHIHSTDAGGREIQAKPAWKRARISGRPRTKQRRSWRIKTQFGNCLVVRAVDLLPGEEFLEHTPSAPLGTKELTHALDEKRVLPQIHETVHQNVALGGASGPIAQRIDKAFRSGALVLVREETGGSGPAAEEAETASSAASTSEQPADSQRRARSVAAQDTAEKTWFRMQLLDEQGRPMAGEDYVVVDSAGTTLKGKLDDSGELYIPPSLPVGQCTINFPNIHLNPNKRGK